MVPLERMVHLPKVCPKARSGDRSAGQVHTRLSDTAEQGSIQVHVGKDLWPERRLHVVKLTAWVYQGRQLAA